MREITSGSKIHVAECDDWIALYIDGERVIQGHSLSWTEVLDALELEYTGEYYEKEESLEKMGNEFPEKQGDLIEEVNN